MKRDDVSIQMYGVLRVKIPKSEVAKARRITIREGTGKVIES